MSGNSAGFGGGLYAQGGTEHYDSSGTVTLTNSSVVNNTATHYSGGGIEAADATLYVVNSTIAHNTASSGGGGISAGPFGAIHLTNSTVTDNVAGGSGGGISAATSFLTATTLAYNRAGSGGGGLTVTGYGARTRRSTGRSSRVTPPATPRRIARSSPKRR